MNTNEMQIFAGGVVLTGIQEAVIDVLLTSQALVARIAEADASNHWNSRREKAHYIPFITV